MANMYSMETLFPDLEENKDFLSKQIITYIGNKRGLLNNIENIIIQVKKKLDKDKISSFDVFSGSGIVARLLKQYSHTLYVNDLELYSKIINSCYLSNIREKEYFEIKYILSQLKQKIRHNLHDGFITKLYAPKDDKHITSKDRVFFTKRNAQYIDTARQEISLLPYEIQKYFLAPLIYSASVHNNTSGVFKGFYKNKLGIGQYGGEGKNALQRILGNIELEMPVFSSFFSQVYILQEEAHTAITDIPYVDFAYLDPPYNQHPYGSNYFMLNLIANYQEPREISKVSGIPKEWNHSKYNQKSKAQETLFSLIENIRAKYVLISYNSEGFIEYKEFVKFLSSLGELEIFSIDYNTFRGSRNLNKRNLYVKEFLFLLKKEI
jgi:Adenine-specific DNA methylase